MIFRQLFESVSCTYTYLLGCERTRQAVLIDSVKDNLALYQQLLTELDLTLYGTLDTHTHADHVTASGALKQAVGSQIFVTNPQVDGADRVVKPDETIQVGDLQIKAIATPGHTDDSFCFLVDKYLFTGDTLLIRGTGRTDFQNGDSKAAYHSLMDKLLRLPDDTWVYPGHDYQGMTVSTILEEKRFNPRLQVADSAAYAQLMDQLNLPKPKQIEVAMPANLRCGV